MLIQMKLAIAKNSGVVTASPKFKNNWTFKDNDIVVSLYHQVVEALEGVMSLVLYNAYFLIFGKGVAQYAAKKFNFDCPQGTS